MMFESLLQDAFIRRLNDHLRAAQWALDPDMVGNIEDAADHVRQARRLVMMVDERDPRLLVELVRDSAPPPVPPPPKQEVPPKPGRGRQWDWAD